MAYSIAYVQDLIRQTAASYGVSPALALALAQRESSFRQDVRGAAGEVGVFQLMPTTAAEVGVDPFSLAGNVQGGIAYLRKQLDRFGSEEMALAAYNAGPGNVSRGVIPASTVAYVQRILGDRPSYESLEEVAGAPGADRVYLPEVPVEKPGLSPLVLLSAGLGLVAVALFVAD